jgi:cation transport regulator ChaC
MSRQSGQDDPRRPNRIKPPDVDQADHRIHDAVAECVQQAAEENGTTAEYVFRHVQQLIQQGWKTEDAELVGSRALGVLNAMNHPPPAFGP